jgi:hypothetical protein
VGSNSRLANLPKPVKALLLITQTMPTLEHISLQAPPCQQPSNPVLGGSLSLLITSSVLRLKICWKSSNFGSGYLIFFLKTQDSHCFFFLSEFSQPGNQKKKGLTNPTTGFLRLFKNKFAVS